MQILIGGMLVLMLLGMPIAYALGYPERGGVPYGRIDWTSLSRLDFQAPDRETFRCLDLAYQAGRIGGTAPAWLSAANEVAVEATDQRNRNAQARPFDRANQLRRVDQVGKVVGAGRECFHRRPVRRRTHR